MADEKYTLPAELMDNDYRVWDTAAERALAFCRVRALADLVAKNNWKAPGRTYAGRGMQRTATLYRLWDLEGDGTRYTLKCRPDFGMRGGKLYFLINAPDGSSKEYGEDALNPGGEAMVRISGDRTTTGSYEEAQQDLCALACAPECTEMAQVFTAYAMRLEAVALDMGLGEQVRRIQRQEGFDLFPKGA